MSRALLRPRLETHLIAGARAGWVPDDQRVFPALTVARNLSIARKTTRFRSWTLKECFEVFSALEHLLERECENLSGGDTSGRFSRTPTFTLEADFSVEAPCIVGVLGPNGSSKTTLFELITGSNQPTSGRVLCGGQDIHQVRYAERTRLAMHYHQSYQVRHFRKVMPSFLLARAASAAPRVHLFDEPQFSPQGGYIGFMLDFFRRLRSEGKLVFVCLHPNEPYHIERLAEICERFIFVNRGRLTQGASLGALAGNEAFRSYLGRLTLLLLAASWRGGARPWVA